jgi:hypothetical protein
LAVIAAPVCGGGGDERPRTLPPPLPPGKVVGLAGVSGWGARDLRRAHAAGARWDRVEFEPGTSFERADRTFATAAEEGLRILPVLNDYRRFAPAADDAFVAWAERFLERYGAGGAFWHGRPDAALAPRTFEVFNEVYASWWGDIGWPDPAGYTSVYRRVVTAGRSLNRGYRFLFSAVHDVLLDGAPVEWADAVTRADPGIGDVIDGLAVHPYGARTLRGDPNSSYAATRRVRESFAAHGITRPVWITEVGLCTSPRASRGVCGDEDDQADAIRYYFADLRRTPWIEALFVYGWRDAGASDPSDFEQWFGLLTHDGRPKPAFRAFREEARR